MTAVLGATGFFGALFLGVLQGLTEFLPVSSSGHLVLFQQLIEVEGDELLFDLMLHLGTLVPAIWFFRSDVAGVLRDPIKGSGPMFERPGVRLAALVVLTSIPTAIIGLGFEDVFESLFATPMAVAVAFAVTGFLLFSTRHLADGDRGLFQMRWQDALLLGLVQGIAITPGISRSGSTIAIALWMGFSREFAVKYSFLMSIPAIGGAALLKLRDVDSLGMDPMQIGVGTLAALVTGYAALAWLVKLVARGRFADFAWYLWFVAAVAAAVAWWGPAGA